MTRPHQWLFLGWFLAVIFCVPLSQAGLEISRGRRPQFLDVFSAAPTTANLRAYERQLEDSSRWAQAVRPYVQYVWFKLLGDAGEKVIVGRQGWLFYKPDVRYLVEPRPDMDEPFAAIADFRDQLKLRGIDLIVMPVPGKPAVYPEKLTRRADGDDSIRSHTLELMDRLQKSGVEIVDLFYLFHRLRAGAETAAPAYLLRDTHWSGQAARLAALMVASRIRERGWPDSNGAEYELRERRIPRRSDIARMIRVPDIEATYPPEEVVCEQVVRADTGELYRDDPNSTVLVLGDSFLRMYQTDDPRAAGFIAHLARALRQPLASVVNDGGASTLVRQELSRRPELLNGKRLVVWEFVERDIRYGTEGWKQVPLPALTPAPSRNP
jgi:hypothetical protein